MARFDSKPSKDKCAYVLGELNSDLNAICDAWPRVVEAAQSFGWPNHSPGYGEHGYVHMVSEGAPDPDDIPPPHADPTGDIASRKDVAAEWLRRWDAVAALMLHLTPSDAETASWDARGLRRPLMRAASDLVELWPMRIERLFQRVNALANEARKSWPATPTKGEVVDGVKVGERTPELETCAECRKPVTGDAADPIRRIDGEPFHAKSCYYRRFRANRKESA